jgi:hypothetical protein
MCRKFILLILILGVASTSYGIVIGNWETTSAEGFVASDGTFTPQVTNGVTLDDYAAEYISGGGYWSFKVETYNSGCLFTAADWLANEVLMFDITRLTSEWTYTPGAGQYSKMNVGMDTSATGSLTTVASSILTWTGGSDNAMTAAVDYSAYKADQGAATWVKITFSTQAANWDTTGAYYIDNVRLVVPEPATICLFGLGALSLYRRRRA